MARKRRPTPEAAPLPAADAQGGPAPLPTPARAPAGASAELPPEITRGDWTVGIFAAMMFLAPALGVPSELMLQDTLKSIVVAMCTLGALLLFLLQQRETGDPARWHALVLLPLALMAYALGSMVWSHTYLGGVEAVRWFVFALIVWLGLNTLSRDRLHWLAWGIFAGAAVASLWAVLQFLWNFGLFPQGPNPASTFVNRNFFAEFAVCTLPFAWILLAQARRSALVALISAGAGLIIVSLMMTGTRAALISLWLQLFVVLPLIAWRCRGQLAWATWSRGLRLLAPAVLLAVVAVLGMIPSQNAKILEEERGRTGIERGILRTQSIRPDDESLGVRMIMWTATLRVIADRPVTGVGAGAWEARIPLYQAERSQLETDYYVHNEYLQLLAEYGVVGWVFLIVLLTYLVLAAARSWRPRDPAGQQEQPWRAVFLCSLLAFLIVSNVGFPWRMASTGALFALCLAGLAASDCRLGAVRRAVARPLVLGRTANGAALAGTAVSIGVALVITWQAAECERKIVQAAKMALAITASGNPNDPRWDASKKQLLQLVRQGVAINPHYRKITPIVADEVARWGDWTNATWIWESVLSSRPYVVAIISNVARGYSSLGDHAKAAEYMERAKRIQPDAPAVRSLEVVLLARRGEEAKALDLAKTAVQRGIYDVDLLNALAVLATRAKDFPLAERAMELRVTAFPESQLRGYLQLGLLYASDLRMPDKAVLAFRRALAAAPADQRGWVLQQVPPELRAQVAELRSVPAPGTQTSASSK